MRSPRDDFDKEFKDSKLPPLQRFRRAGEDQGPQFVGMRIPDAIKPEAIKPSVVERPCELTGIEPKPETAAAPEPSLNAPPVTEPALRFPSAWYPKPEAKRRAQSRPPWLNTAVLGAALVLGGAGSAFLVLQQPPPASCTVGRAATFLIKEMPKPILLVQHDVPPVSADGVETLDLLAAAQRFISSGDVLAARAILSARATSGDASAEFALAETYDPNLLKVWNVTNVDGHAGYARRLYDAALRDGRSDAAARITALP
jgi:hypothetical protein